MIVLKTCQIPFSFRIPILPTEVKIFGDQQTIQANQIIERATVSVRLRTVCFYRSTGFRAILPYKKAVTRAGSRKKVISNDKRVQL